MRNKIAYLSFLLLFPFLLSAQYKDLLKDKSITWIAEFEMDLSFDTEQKGRNVNPVVLKKYVQPKGLQKCDNGNCLVDFLFHHIKKGEVLGYESSDLERPYTIDEVLNMTTSVDTVITFYPETFEEVITVIKNELNPSDIKSCRTKQLLYYDKSSKSLHTRLLAIAPVVTITDANGNPSGKKPLVWVGMEDIFGNDVNSESAAVAWAANIYTMATPLYFNQLNVVKGKVEFSQFIHENAMDGKSTVRSIDSKAGKLISPNEVPEIYSSVDTVIIFDAQTYEETIHIIREDRSYKDITACRLVQDWYYLPEKRLLINRLKAIVPITEVNDKTGKFNYWKPFYKIEYK